MMQAPEQNPVIVYLGSEEPAVELVAWLEAHGHSLYAVNAVAGLAHALKDTRAGTLIVDLAGEGDPLECLASLKAVLATTESRPRVIVCSERADQEVRLRAVQAGSDVFLTAPVSPQLLMQHLATVPETIHQEYRVLLVTDNTDVLAGTALSLRQAGMLVKQPANPAQTLLSLINFMPDVLLIEHPLSGCSGDDIGRMIHQLSNYEDIPVVYFCSGEAAGNFIPRDTASCEVLPVSVDAGRVVTVINRLVRITRDRSNKARYLLNRDRVTGMLNRDGFFTRLNRGVEAKENVTLFLVELENLQYSNPGLSPRELNQLIAGVSAHLCGLAVASLLRARTGDYSFAFLVADKPGDEVRKLGQLLCHALGSRLYPAGQHAINVVCHAGIAVVDSRPENLLPLFSLAVEACEEARLAGRNRACVRRMESEEVTALSQEDRLLLEQLHLALEKDSFRLVYQPIAPLHGNTVEKYEVLLRLPGADNAVIPASRFVPLAEQGGLMRSIDLWVVGNAVKLLRERGSATSLFVKTSSASIGDPGFPARLKVIFDKHGYPGSRLVFEICESNIRAGLLPVEKFANRIKQLGCGLALEHNDLDRDVAPFLERIPASYVKINGQVLADIAVNHGRLSQLEEIIRSSEEYRARVIAGFVENAGSLQLLWKCGVHYIQGNFLQEPAEVLGFNFGEEDAG